LAQQASPEANCFWANEQMKKLTECHALLFALLVSSVSLFATLTSAVVFGKQSRSRESKNVNTEIVIQGRQIFVKHCAECHGFDARGDEGSDLHNLRAGDALIGQIIIGGVKGEMPAYGKVLNAADVRALTSYLRTLRSE
jgi:mono/diheme cytochrome c family protein